MGADAHGGAALRHLSGEVQQTLTACEADAVGVHPGAGQDVLAAGQPGRSGAARVGKDLFRGAGAEHLPAVHDDHVPAQAVSLVPVVGACFCLSAFYLKHPPLLYVQQEKVIK